MIARSRLFVLLFFVHCIPLLATAWLVHRALAHDQVVAHRHARRKTERVARVRRAKLERTRLRVARFFCGRRDLMKPVFADSDKNEVRRTMDRRLRAAMNEHGLHALVAVDLRSGPHFGQVLAQGHRVDDIRRAQPELARALLKRPDRSRMHRLWLRRANTVGKRWMLATGCASYGENPRFGVFAGHLLEDSLRSLSPNLRLFLEPAEDHSRSRVIHEFRDVEGFARAVLVFWAEDSATAWSLKKLTGVYGIGVALVLALAALLSAWLTRTTSQAWFELETAARRVGEGDLSSQISFGHGSTSSLSHGSASRTAGAFNRMTAELRATQKKLRRAERVAAWRDIARYIAHEIKNPLLPIQVSIETLRKAYKRSHPDFQEIFLESTSTTLEEVARIERIVNEFSEFARLPAPRVALVDVAGLLTRVANLHRGAVWKRSGEVAIELQLSKNLPRIRADGEQLMQVFVNLVQNAGEAALARHGERGGCIEISAAPMSPTENTTHMIGVTIRDNGPGIPLDQQDRIFEPYYTTKARRGAESETNTGGTGIGLAVAQRIVDQHHGQIEVGSSPTGGASMDVRLPVDGPPDVSAVSHPVDGSASSRSIG